MGRPDVPVSHCGGRGQREHRESERKDGGRNQQKRLPTTGGLISGRVCWQLEGLLLAGGVAD